MKMVVASILAMVLTACATQYQRQGATGGFSETQLADNVFQVTFKGNGYTDGEKATDYALLRSAELALEHGFSYFVLVDSQQYSKQSIYTTPTQTYATATAYGNSAYGTSTTYGGQTFLVSKPRTTNTIFCLKERPQGFAFEAQFIVRSLRQKYGFSQGPDTALQSSGAASERPAISRASESAPTTISPVASEACITDKDQPKVGWSIEKLQRCTSNLEFVMDVGTGNMLSKIYSACIDNTCKTVTVERGIVSSVD